MKDYLEGTQDLIKKIKKAVPKNGVSGERKIKQILVRQYGLSTEQEANFAFINVLDEFVSDVEKANHHLELAMDKLKKHGFEIY